MSVRPTDGRWVRRPGRRCRGASALVLATFLVCTAASAAPAPPVPSGPSAAPGSSPPLVLVPPLETSRRLKIQALAVHADIDRVVFFVDGRQVASDGRRPYRTTVDLDPTAPAGRSLRAVAYDRSGAVVAEDSLALGRTEAPRAGQGFEVAIVELRGDPGEGDVELEAHVSVPDADRLVRVDVFHNQRLAARLPQPGEQGRSATVRTRLELTDAGADDFLRVVAHLADGRTLEDARALAGAGGGERLDVCLVDLFAVVSDRWGDPVRGLEAEDFRVSLGGRKMAVTGFQEADQVPLALGLLVDSSESMTLIMDDTKEAAKRFLERTLVPGDRAFLVDVDTVPRLVREMSPSPAELADAFAGLEPGGTTALYDAILMGLLRLERHQGRRALVVLTDGLDVGSDFGPELCRRHAERSGVPVYVLAMSGLPGQSARPGRNFRLEALARRTGGRVFAVGSLEEIDRAYVEIDRELRSQYVLALGSDRVLSEDELARIEVEVDRRGTTVRATRSLARD